MTTLQTVNYQDPKKMREAISEFKTGTLEVIATGYMTVGKNPLMPVITIDTTNRADLLDLVRVHRQEGELTTETKWDFLVKPGWVGLARFTVTVTSPIKTKFSILFHLGKHADYLERIVSEFTYLCVIMDKAPITDSIAFVYDQLSLVEGLDLDDMAHNVFRTGKGGQM